MVSDNSPFTDEGKYLLIEEFGKELRNVFLNFGCHIRWNKYTTED